MLGRQRLHAVSVFIYRGCKLLLLQLGGGGHDYIPINTSTVACPLSLFDYCFGQPLPRTHATQLATA